MSKKFIKNIGRKFSGITLNIGPVGFNFDRSGSCRVYIDRFNNQNY